MWLALLASAVEATDALEWQATQRRGVPLNIPPV